MHSTTQLPTLSRSDLNDIQILALDRAFTPDRWMSIPEALNLLSRDAISYHLGETALTLRGGINAATGKQSTLNLGSIIVLKSNQWLVRDHHHSPFSRALLFKRDKHLCAYCGNRFPTSELTMDHILPASRNGDTSWTNIVTACKSCNQKKADRTPSEANMALLYVPYQPNRNEWLILRNRHVLADQMEFLCSHLPAHSRILQPLN